MSSSCEEIKKKSLTDIFNEMLFCDKMNNCKFQNCSNCLKTDKAFDCMESYSELSRILKYTPTIKLLDNAVVDAIKAQKKWKNSSSLERVNLLYRIWKCLSNASKMSNFANELLTLASYFDFYADLAIHTEEYKNLRPWGIVLILLSNYSPFFFLGATVAPAVATGCSVIVVVPEKFKNVSFFLAEIISDAGLPEGVFNIVTEFNEINIPVSKDINKIFFCGSYLSAQTLYRRNVNKSFSFFSPSNTAALILESGDLDAAADKIVTETWVKNSLFPVSNIVIQESIYKKFLKKLKYRLQQFLNTNKYSAQFKYKILSEKVNEIRVVAFDEKSTDYENEIMQTDTENHQNYDINWALTVFKVQLCRTAKEGVILLNNCQYNLGTSIWSEISSQAVEISSMLACPNIWINNHGMFEAGEPLQLLGSNGNCVLGGIEGVFEYFTFCLDPVTEESKINEDENLNYKNVTALQMAVSAQCAFNIWQHNKSRRQCLKVIAHSLPNTEECSKLSEIISSYAHMGNLATFSQRMSQGHLVLKKKVPVGVFLLLVNTTNISVTSFASLITPIIAFGNAVIVIFKETIPAIQLLITKFTEVLPKNLFNVMVGIRNGIYLAFDPHIQAIWVYEESAVSVEFLQSLKSHSTRSLKNVWVIPNNLPSPYFFQKECLRNHVVWLTDIDQYP